MTAVFVHNTVLPKDPGGWGLWLTEHYYEHIRFILTARDLADPVELDEYDIWSWSDEPAFVQSWLMSHQQMHQGLRELTNVGGIDLQAVDMTDSGQFLVWQESHRLEHNQLNLAFGFA